MTRLGSLLQVHPTSVTSAVDRLERQGYVERQRQDEDRRVVLAAITEAGRAVVEQATDGLNTDVFERPGLDAGQLEALTGLLGVLRRGAGDAVD
jgi:DNA-binding MarR family transcriptional regulator